MVCFKSSFSYFNSISLFSINWISIKHAWITFQLNFATCLSWVPFIVNKIFPIHNVLIFQVSVRKSDVHKNLVRKITLWCPAFVVWKNGSCCTILLWTNTPQVHSNLILNPLNVKRPLTPLHCPIISPI